MDCLASKILSQKVYSYKCQFCTKIEHLPFQSSRLVSQDQMMAVQNLNPNDVLDPNQNVEKTCNSKLKVT